MISKEETQYTTEHKEMCQQIVYIIIIIRNNMNYNIFSFIETGFTTFLTIGVGATFLFSICLLKQIDYATCDR